MALLHLLPFFVLGIHHLRMLLFQSRDFLDVLLLHSHHFFITLVHLVHEFLTFIDYDCGVVLAAVHQNSRRGIAAVGRLTKELNKTDAELANTVTKSCSCSQLSKVLPFGKNRSVVTLKYVFTRAHGLLAEATKHLKSVEMTSIAAACTMISVTS
jgi:hypothetical protein